ncbi:4-hydroxy-tetrahydrodipicolinate synthase [Nocardia bovistercoris]|uniref:4-hydroxy-tetrahydrodipicolinate synthase n=1 Tax=Nocardia bovistercoris TaxID=2785916 RepID=A0A931IAT6_9NOCA|nr:4-hydroxy-tetrahydrodipicolinate synthase [Nocardia bovistercoris]MBH0776485.1 4-hydroxy-tetrahydrodipicolinate synthase [Nocardia bovistercoris]
MSLTGLFVPLITPFTTGGELAADALAGLAHRVLDAGAAGLVALGTTGEPATLSPEERARVLDVCASVCAERSVPLLAGAGTNCTADSVRALAALDPRVSAALTVVPYYTRPSQPGVVAHFRALAAASPLPLVVYNIPYRTGRTLDTETLREVAEIPNVIGFKHSAGVVDDTTAAFLATHAHRTAILAGDDVLAPALLALGATGAILAAANIAPAQYAGMLAHWHSGRLTEARRTAHQLTPLSSALFAEPNPTVLKTVLTREGHIPSPTVRLPLLPASEASTEAALHALHALEN